MNDLGLFLIRVGVGTLMAYEHGWPKLANFFQIAPQFPDPIGMGSTFSLALAVFAEFFCSILVVLGIKARFAAIPVAITMWVAVFVVHAADPLSKKEFALLYAIPFTAIALMGSGKLSFPSMAEKMKVLE